MASRAAAASDNDLGEAPGQGPPRGADAFVLAAVSVLAVTAGYSLWCGTPLIYDGAYQFAWTLVSGEPYQYLTRFHTWILWRPVVIAAHFTDSPRTLLAIFGAPFLLAPAFSLAMTWWFVRRQAPWLIVWAGFGLMITPLPGQIFVINDSTIQQHLFWPVFLGLFVRLTRWQWVVLVALAVFQFPHQIGVVLMGGASAALVLLAMMSEGPERRRLFRHAAFAATVFALVLAKTWWTSTPGTPYYDSYAANEASWELMRQRWFASVGRIVSNGLRCAYAAGLLVLVRSVLARHAPAWLQMVLGVSAAACLVKLGIDWTQRGLVPRYWIGSLDYRRWLVPLTLPIHALAVVDQALRIWAGRGSSRGDAEECRFLRMPMRAGMALLMSLVFAATLGVQSHIFGQLSRRMYAHVMASPKTAVPWTEMRWLQDTAVPHWSMSWHVLVLQGKKPGKFLIPVNVEEQHLACLDGPNPRLPITWFEPLDVEPGPLGWFDTRDLAKQVQRELGRSTTRPAPPVQRP